MSLKLDRKDRGWETINGNDFIRALRFPKNEKQISADSFLSEFQESATFF